MSSRKIIKVTKTEFETADGTIHPIPFDLDEEPSLEEFQQQYDHWHDVFISEGLIETNEENDQHRNSRRLIGRGD